MAIVAGKIAAVEADIKADASDCQTADGGSWPITSRSSVGAF
jgi:hypothetical protein